MQTYELTISNRQITASGDTTLVRTSRGVDELHIHSDDMEWYEESLVSGGGRRLDVILSNPPVWRVKREIPTTEGDGWGTTVQVPEVLLRRSGRLGVTVRTVPGDTHLITAEAYPLTIEADGITNSGGEPMPERGQDGAGTGAATGDGKIEVVYTTFGAPVTADGSMSWNTPVKEGDVAVFRFDDAYESGRVEFSIASDAMAGHLIFGICDWNGDPESIASGEPLDGLFLEDGSDDSRIFDVRTLMDYPCFYLRVSRVNESGAASIMVSGYDLAKEDE